MLDELLEYHQVPETDDFVIQVMKGVRRQQRIRRMILWASGLVGAGFGIAGMAVLSEPLGALFQGTNIVYVSAATAGIIAFLTWMLHDDAALGG